MTDENSGMPPAPAVVETPAQEPQAEPATAVDETNVAPVEAKEPTIPKPRFDEVYRNWREEQREKEFWKERAMRGEPQPAKEPEAPAQLPTPEQFGFDDAKYQAALVDYNKAIAKAEAAKTIEEWRQQEKQQAREKSFKQREAEFLAKTPDYRDKVYNPAVPISAAMVELIAESPDGPALAYYLANNVDVAQQIFDLPPVLAAREIGRIEAKLAQPAAAPPKPKPVTQAPPPPPTLEATEAPAVSVKPTDPESDKELSDAEWMKLRERQLKRQVNKRGS